MGIAVSRPARSQRTRGRKRGRLSSNGHMNAALKLGVSDGALGSSDESLNV